MNNFSCSARNYLFSKVRFMYYLHIKISTVSIGIKPWIFLQKIYFSWFWWNLLKPLIKETKCMIYCCWKLRKQVYYAVYKVCLSILDSIFWGIYCNLFDLILWLTSFAHLHELIVLCISTFVMERFIEKLWRWSVSFTYFEINSIVVSVYCDEHVLL